MQISVLLVDDAKDFVEYMKKRLVARGMTISTAFNGQTAIDIVKEQSFDVVVLDVLMPGMDGIETLQEIKKIRPELPVIMLTGHGTVESAAEGMKLGACDYLLKPCDLDTLLGSIQSAYEKSSQQ
ncbi:MAG: response regulator [Proteobacteria bacterium]|nr:response regulator [Pseudomonadota bacterium]